MSYSFDGKIVNQFPKYKSASIICICAKCNKIVPNPKKLHLQDDKRVYIVNSYLQEPYYVYETNSGRAVVYCSKYCMKKHNHRFNTVKKKHPNDEIIERVEKALKNKDKLHHVKEDNLDLFMENLIYNIHGKISLKEIREQYENLLKQEPYSTVYSVLVGQFYITYIGD